MKKIFSVILAAMLIFTCSVNAFADEIPAEQSIVEEDVQSEETQEDQDSADKDSAEIQNKADENKSEDQNIKDENSDEIQNSVNNSSKVETDNAADSNIVNQSSADNEENENSEDENSANENSANIQDAADANAIGESAVDQNSADENTSEDQNAADTSKAEVKTLEQKLSEAKAVTAIPFSEKVNITNADIYKDNGSNMYGKAYKLSVAEGDAFRVSFYGNEDTVIDLYKYNGSSYERITSYDYGELPFEGEALEHYYAEAGEYYFIARTYDIAEAVCTLELEKIEYGKAVEIEDAPDFAEPVSGFPFETEVQIGGPSGMIEVDFSGGFLSVAAYKFNLDKGECINFSFDTSAESAPGMCYIRDRDWESSEYYFMSDYSDGAKAIFSAPEAGEYILCIYDYFSDTPASYPLSIEAVSYPSVEELLDSAYSIDAISEGETYSEKIEFDGSVTYAPDTNVNSNYYYAKAYKATLSKDDTLYIDFAGVDNINTVIAVYEKNGETYDIIDLYDNDNLMDRGECAQFNPEEAGEYYFIARTYGKVQGSTMLDIAFNIHPTNPYTGLDFTVDPAPVPQDGDPWSWDAASKTLTLKDGFSVDAYYEHGIKLPDGATIVIEPGAAVDISSESKRAISGVGSLTINMGAGSSLNVNSYNIDAVYAEDSLVITGSKSDRPVIKGYAQDDNLNSENGDLVLSDLEIDFNSQSDGFYVGGALDVTSCSIKIRCDNQGIDVDNNSAEKCKAVITDSTLDIESGHEEAIRAHDLSIINCDTVLGSPLYDGISCLLDENMNGGIFVCKGGSLKADVYWYAVYAEGSIEMSDVKLNLSSSNYEAVYCTSKEPVLDAANTYNVYSADGNVYTEKLQIVITYSDGRCVAMDGSPIVKIVPVYAVTFYDDDGVTVLKETQYVEEGAAAVAPEDPVKESDGKYEYTFAGWSEEFDSVDHDMDIKATYTATAITPEDPDEPTDPSEPGEPTEPTDPSEPSKPEEPTDPSEPSEPDKPTKPSDTKDPEDQKGPTASPKPTSQPDSETTSGKGSPETGDGNDDILPLVLMVVLAGGAVTGITVYSRKKN